MEQKSESIGLYISSYGLKQDVSPRAFSYKLDAEGKTNRNMYVPCA